jgi:hypothetical protein
MGGNRLRAGKRAVRWRQQSAEPKAAVRQGHHHLPRYSPDAAN